MKKTYEKPQILFDSFELSQDIAAGCKLMGTHAEGTCKEGIDPESGLAFFGESTCSTYVPGPYDEICYHVPMGDNTVFAS